MPIHTDAPQPCQSCEARRDILATNPLQPTGWHPRFCARHDIHQPPDADTRRFLSKDIADGIRGLFTGGIRQNDPISSLDLSTLQRTALIDWEHASAPIGKRTTTPFALAPIFHIFDRYYFCGALRDRVDVSWTPDTLRGADRKFYTTDAASSGGSLHRAAIFIQRPRAGIKTWTKQLVKETLQTLLHEMVHAVFAVYECRCGTCARVDNRARNTGVSGSGHGPVWRELGQAVQEEANRMFDFGGDGGRWDLDVGRWGGSHVGEVRAILEMRREGEIGEVEGLVDAMLA
ncbi:MAG: hypothetical protein Q9161_002525 [Pseudevernia consocians]